MFTVTLIDMPTITVSDRQRKDLGDLGELKTSFEREGQLNPIILDEHNNLIAGERRLRAAQELEWTQIHARIMPGLTKDQTLLIEMAENLGRKDFHWSEELQAKLSLYQYYSTQEDDFSYRKMAKKLGVSIGGLSTDLELAKAILEIPELTAYNSKGQARTAYKKLQTQAQAVIAMDKLSDDDKARLQEMMNIHSEPARNVTEDTSKITAPVEQAIQEDEDAPVEALVPERGKNLLECHAHMDDSMPKFIYEICKFNDLLKKIPDETIGFVEADPPYAINFESIYGKAQDIKSTAQDWSLTEFRQNMEILLFNLKPKLLQNSWILIWTGAEHEEWLQEMAVNAGYGIQSAGFWIKQSGGSNTPSTTMIHNYEKYLLLRYGDARFNIPSVKAAIEFSPVPHGNRYHQWQKPLDLYAHFMKACGKPGSFFFSPFAGSGYSMIAASLAGMTPIGCDINKKYIYQFYDKLKEHTNGCVKKVEESIQA